jgi:hypothetical protein
MIKQYTIMIRGHKTIFAESEKRAYELVDKDLEAIHPNFNLRTYVEQ